MQKLFNEIKELSIEDLRILNKFIIETVNSKKDIQTFQIGAKLKVNMTVKVKSEKFANKKFTVSKINRKNAILKLEGTITEYNVPLSLIIVE